MLSTVDMSGVAQKAYRIQVERLLKEQHIPLQIESDFWSRFLVERSAESFPRTLVLCDLSTVIRRFRNADTHVWRTSVRTLQPFFLALVRTKKDLESVEWLDDIIRASDLRLEVCNKADDFGVLSQCMFSALRSLEPDFISDARYSRLEDRFWVQFGDGLSGTWTWDDLHLGFLADRVVPESVTPSTAGSSIELIQNDGGIYDIDSGAIRSFFDSKYRENVVQAAAKHRVSFGERLKQVRTSTGLTQTQLGVKSNLDQAVISRIEKGKVRPRLDTLDRIATSLDMSISDLLAYEA